MIEAKRGLEIYHIWVLSLPAVYSPQHPSRELPSGQDADENEMMQLCVKRKHQSPRLCRDPRIYLVHALHVAEVDDVEGVVKAEVRDVLASLGLHAQGAA